MAGKITLPHICPKCLKKKAESYQELEEKFGFRNVSNGVINQSWCRKCRSTTKIEKKNSMPTEEESSLTQN